ncbi:type VI secretion system Vgr family protein [Phyllobacterium myrsinacearum]|uniref:Type VI secretion system secreted protein VgrG n=1 Tax=Phyllobacterium myrsinacearum TaxID=28101 RepID=A0A839EV67_9HYPH|nr:type VI secretion system tip protein TssI/VgrG [Phyllobacterium myrsinacearum]MBA8882048.1 type VI secretion system secreted protein VgrG [Phyllobacterium myrsinacearum]
MEFDFTDAGLIQADRILRISTSLGTDVLLAEKVDIREEISGLFEIHVDVKSKRTDIRPEELVGTFADVSLEIAYGQRRPWNGLITGFREGPPVSRGLRSYRLIIRPQLWLLSQRSDCRIWMDMTTLQIAKTLLSEHGINAAVTGGVVNPPSPIHYSVQWNETDLAYLTRRLEFDGLFYWFEHEDGQHTLHIASHPFGYKEGPETNVRFAAGSTDRNHISEFARDYRFTPGKRAGGDWNFEKPQGPQGATTPSLVSLPKNAEYELFHYPSKAMDQTSNDQASKLRMQAVEADHEKIEGSSTVRTLAAGRKFKPYEVAHADHAFEEYVVTAIVHRIVDHSYETVEDGALDYSNSFIALPSRLPATPHRGTPQPRIDGSQVAIVAGPSGEEIHPDEYGRIKVWFPWQRNRAKKDGSDTCWIRVMQSWAGGGFGAQVIPRIGMEVMVTYLEGDPDRPVITGIVPNPSTKVPYTLPDNKTKSTFRTNTHKGEGFNELTFEDENGQEEIYIHAQRDNRIHVGNSRSKRVDNNQAESIGHNKTIEVGNNHHEVIGGNMTLMVGPNILQKGVTAAMQVLRSKARDLLSSNLGALTDKLGFLSDLTMGEGNMVIGVGKNKAETVMVSSSEIVGAAKTVMVGGGYQLAVGGIRNESTILGAYEEVGQNKTIVVGKKFEIVCGKSRFQMDEDGNIMIKGVSLQIDQGKEIKIKTPRMDNN